MKKPVEYILLSAVLLTVFAVYLHTMHPAFKNNDSPETTASAVTLGIGHPPAYPLYTMAGKILTFIPLGNHAFRMNIFSSLLALLTLLIAYFTVKKHLFRLAGFEHGFYVPALSLGLLPVLAFCGIFWNQGIEAKGGIYMMNLFFTASIIYLSLELFVKPQKKHFYLIAFILGLGLANHWPSMLVLTPVFAYVFVKYARLLKWRGFMACGMLVIAGITPYLYLLIRARTGAVLNWGAPADMAGLLWVVLRKGYAGPVEPSVHVFKYQIIEFLKLFFTNYSLFFMLAFAGGYSLYKKSKSIFWYLLSLFAVIAVMVVFYNRTKENVIYLIDIFLMPAEYICFLFIAAGAAAFAAAFYRNKPVLYAAGTAAFALAVFMGFCNYRINNSRLDYLSYDFGKAIFNTMEEGSVYLADGDYNLMPVYYMQDVMKNRRDVITATDSFLIFKWGIADFIEKHGLVEMKAFDTANNEKNIIDKFLPAKNIYRSSYFPRFDNFSPAYAQEQKGILVKIGKNFSNPGAGIFSLYSYRGIFRNFCLLNRANIDLVGWYAVSMVNQANALNVAGKPAQAVRLYRLALNFPVEKPEANICYNAALAYEKMKDYDNELLYLERSLQKDPNLMAALEKTGFLYYENGLYAQAKDILERALSIGGYSENVKKGYDILNAMSETQILEAMLIKANDYIEKKDLKKAVGIYDFLLEKGYKTVIINTNIGVYHFRTGNFKIAIDCFARSKNETPTVEAYLYTAYAYFKMGAIEKAEIELEDGLKKFKNDKSLNDLYRQLKEREKRNEKNTDSNYGQR